MTDKAPQKSPPGARGFAEAGSGARFSFGRRRRQSRPPAAEGRDAQIIRSVARQLGVRLAAPGDLVRAVERTLPLAAIDRLRAFGHTDKEITAIVIPPRTLAHRRANRETRLSREESDKAVRLARIAALAEIVFGDRAVALRWLREPKAILGGAAPMDRLATGEGARAIEELLYRIDHGMAA